MRRKGRQSFDHEWQAAENRILTRNRLKVYGGVKLAASSIGRRMGFPSESTPLSREIRRWALSNKS